MSRKNTLQYQRSYRRKLPHIQPPGATFFITFRLAGSLPRDVWVDLRARLDAIYEAIDEEAADNQALIEERERLWFAEYERRLHKSHQGPFWLREDRIASLVTESLHYHDRQRYRLDAFCVMPNHVHTVLRPLPTEESAREALLSNKLVLVKDRDGNVGYIEKGPEGMRQFIPITFHSLAAIMHSIKRRTASESNKLLGRSGSFWEDESYDRFARSDDEWRRTIKYVLNNPVKAGLVNGWTEWRWSWSRGAR